MPRQTGERLDNEKQLFWWSAVYCPGGHYLGGKAGIVWASNRDEAILRVDKDYPKRTWSVIVSDVGDGDMVALYDL